MGVNVTHIGETYCTQFQFSVYISMLYATTSTAVLATGYTLATQ